ncbi:MAG: C10 family peptidase [Desulfobaccales bacterium]
MRRPSGILSVWLFIWLLGAVLLAVPGAWAKPTTPQQAQTAVMNWLGLDAMPLGAAMGRQVKEVQTFNHEGAPAYYVVYLNPAGLVILPADDLVEPIIAFLPSGYYDPSPANPLGALVSQDLPGRVLQARAVEAKGPETLAPETPHAQAQQKWSLLLKPTGPKASEFGVSSISDVRVASFVGSRWDQSTVNGNNCYNYYTPYNYVCGCVATAMSQLIRYWQWPTSGIGRVQKVYYVHDPYNTNPLYAYTRGGDDNGGAYVWGNMALVPTSGVTQAQRQAIGRLTSDVGLSVNMNYDTEANGGSGTDTLKAADALVNTFQYSNAKKGYNSGNNLPDTNRNAMVNPNLHAGYPVLFGIMTVGVSGGHAIVCDGYGYESSTMYHHLNLGWSGSQDAWYNLPNIGTGYGFNSVYKCIYNVYPSGSGEIIAGRVTNTSGTPLSHVTVSSSDGSIANTDDYGIYALPRVASNHTFTVTASLSGYTSSSQSVTTGTSTNNTITTGNKWPIDFALNVLSIPLSTALDNTKLSFNTGGNANWAGENATWYYGGSAAQSGAITANQYAQLWTTVTGPGTLSFYWKVSSEAAPPGQYYDYLGVWIDDTFKGSIDGEVNWTKVKLTIPKGIHTITWQYSKDAYVDYGSDCGWVDKVVYTRKSSLDAFILLLLN